MATDVRLEDLPAGQKLISARLLQVLGCVLLGLVVVAAAAGAYAIYGLFTAQSKIIAEQRENAANAAVIATAVNDLQVIQRQFAERATNDCARIGGLSHWIRSLNSPVRNGLPNVAGVLTTLDNFCRPGQDGYAVTDTFLTAYVPAVTARQGRDYATAASQYQKAADTTGIQPALKVRAYEGAAYSNLKLGKLDAARTASQEGRKLGVDYIYTDITALKLACSENIPAAEVNQQFGALQAERQKIIVAAKDDKLKAIAEADLGLAMNDPELAAMCRYAHLPL